MNRPRPSIVRRRRGMGLVELLISLTIATTLLVAIGASFYASAQAVATNDEFFRASQIARTTITQVQANIRTCQDCQVGNSYDGHSTSVSADVLRFHNADGVEYAYIYDADNEMLSVKDVAAGETHVLARHLKKPAGGYLFTADMEPDPATMAMRPVRVSMAFTVRIAQSRVSLAASSVPRRATIQ